MRVMFDIVSNALLGLSWH